MAMRGNPALVISGLTLANPHVGQGVYTLRLLHGLARRGRNDFVVVAPPAIERPAELSAENFCVTPPFRAPRQPMLNQIFAARALLDFVRKKFPGAIFHSPGPIVGSKKPGQTIVTLHDCLYRHFPNYDGRFLVRRTLAHATERFAGRADLVLTDSEFSREDLIARTKIPSNKIEVLYPWVGPEFLAPIPLEATGKLRTKLQLPERFWLYLGGYDFRKNIEFLLEAYASARRQSELPPLVLAGQLPTKRNRATCDVQAALERNRLTSEQVIQPGRIAASDLPALYRAAALFIFPSLGEGFGLPPAEAMAAGCPVLASNVTSLPEVVRNSQCGSIPGICKPGREIARGRPR